MNINAYGLWAMRICLVIGAITGGLMKNEDVSGGCIFALIISFFVFDEESY